MGVLERLRGINIDTIQGVERVYFYDQCNFDVNQKPITVMKSKFTLKKISRLMYFQILETGNFEKTVFNFIISYDI